MNKCIQLMALELWFRKTLRASAVQNFLSYGSPPCHQKNVAMSRGLVLISTNLVQEMFCLMSVFSEKKETSKFQYPRYFTAYYVLYFIVCFVPLYVHPVTLGFLAALIHSRPSLSAQPFLPCSLMFYPEDGGICFIHSICVLSTTLHGITFHKVLA